MKLTDRDIRLVRDIALSHVLSRDQMIELGYFTSVSRCNRTLARLKTSGLVTTLTTPFFGQRLSVAGSKAKEVVGEKIARLLAFRQPTPRFLQHSLAVTEVRVALLKQGGTGWRFEPQLKHAFAYKGALHEVRPDGLICLEGEQVLLEVDLGHVSARKFREKLLTYKRYWDSGSFRATYGNQPLRVLTLSTTPLRCHHLAALATSTESFRFATFESIGVSAPGGWS